MGRYKFPGKPTKHVNKKRINVLSDTITKSHESSIGYNNEFFTFGINNEYCDTNQANNLSAHTDENSDEIQSDTVSESAPKCTLFASNSSLNTITLKDNQKNENVSILKRSRQSSAFLYKKYSLKPDGLTKSKTKSLKDVKRLLKKGIINKKDMHDSTSFKFSPRKTIYTRKKLIENRKSITSRKHEREPSNLVGKFVLPSKSLHSSRVIKPNKRFVNNEQIYKSNNIEYLPKPKKRKTKNRRTLFHKENLKHEIENTVIDQPLNSENISPDIITSNSCSVIVSSENERDSNDMVLIDSRINNSSWSCGKLVLRKARLQLNTQTLDSMDGPFSNYTSNSANSPPGTVTCGVCGAVRFYRFVKQARKFNIYSCESCRKFISKMIKKQTCTKNCVTPMLICHKGQGMCHVPPIVRSQQWKLLRCAYKARCPACWLKMCLQSFQMPPQLKANLTKMLPENMRTLEKISKPKPVCIQDSSKVEISIDTQSINWPSKNLEKRATTEIVLEKNSVDEKTENRVSPVKLDILSSKTDTLLNNIKETRTQRSRSRLANQKRSSTLESTHSITGDRNKRHKLDIKGPRVKHVCRSASIVLGQPLATFSNVCSTESTEKLNSVCEVPNECVNCNKSVSEERNETLEGNNGNNNIVSSPKNVCLVDMTEVKENKASAHEDSEEDSIKPFVSISSDYFENYDAEEKIHRSGFGLVGSKPFSIQAVCFYCGSAGQGQLLYCTCCCEPYHYYCVEDTVINRYFIKTADAINNFVNTSWRCSRCATCEACGKVEGIVDNKKFTCKSCRLQFHPECVQNFSKFPMLCSSCLHCEDCGSKEVTDLICNLTLCLLCFKSRKKEKCVICLKEDVNYKLKMYKCDICEYFIHLDCEQLTNDMRHILNYLPNTSTISCSSCSAEKLSSWKETATSSIANGFHIVLRLMIRNLAIKEALNWNLSNSYDCSCQPVFKNIETSGFIKKYDRSRGKQNKDLDISLKNIQKKFCVRECSVRIKDCLDIKDKNWNKVLEEEIKYNKNCRRHGNASINSLLIIKKKINSFLYKNVEEFYFDIQKILSDISSIQNVINSIIKDIFPWFIPNKARIKVTEIMQTNLKIINCQHIECEESRRNNEATALSIENHLGANLCMFDERKCEFCNKIGDQIAILEGRLLYCGHNQWVHINCAFWSTDIYEELDSSFHNIHTTISSSRKKMCSSCRKNGASVKCSIKNCSEIFHYLCARKNCTFFKNKAICCSSHKDVLICKSTILNVKDFVILRPVFINFDMKKKDYIEPTKIHFLIGSLKVTNLGTFSSPFSDTEEAIIPTDFICSRLFWSITEPWKTVRYTITTSIYNPALKGSNQFEKNFTIDHSLPGGVIEQKLLEINKWNNDIEYGKNENIFLNPSATIFEKNSVNITDDDKIVLQVLEHLLEITCNKECEENCDDEPQNSADILPPELKEAIFEDLPHDILDGISMQDIFPKLMSYEDVVTMDLKSLDTYSDLKDLKNDSDNETLESAISECSQKAKKSDRIIAGSEFWLEPKYSFQEDSPQSEKRISEKNGQQLKRSKSEVITGIKKLTKSCNHQRSCSMTWSCKLDNIRTSNMKKRKMSCKSKSVTDVGGNVFMVLDGSSEKGAMLQELRFPEGVLMSMGHSTPVDCISDRVRELKYRLEETPILSADRFKSQNQGIEHEKENKCILWRNKPQTRVLQTDGPGDSSSEDEQEVIKTDLLSSNEEPVKCDRCQCTYRTLNSYKKHLCTCDFISSSESESEEQTTISSLGVSELNTMSNTTNNDLATITTISNENINYNYSTEITSQNINITVSYDNTITKSNVDTKPIVTTTTQFENKVTENCITTSEILSSSNNITVHDKMPSNTTETLSTTILKKNKITKVAPKQIKPKTTKPRAIATCSRGKQKIAKFPANKTNINIQANPFINQNNAIRLLDGSGNASGPTVIIQHVPSPNLIPAYVESFQHQTGQNLQCIATIVPNDYNQNPFLTTNSFVPQTFQIQQPTEPVNQIINMPNAGFSIIPDLDSVNQQPVISSFVNQNRTPTFQCGLVSGDQIMLNSFPTVDTIVTETPAPCFQTQPMFYGFETIVQNTVMQQFVSSAVPGVLAANSSYTATTTQVYQSGKLEPIVNLNGGGYLIVNNSTVPQVTTPLTVNTQPVINKPANILAPQPTILEQSTNSYPIQIVPVCEPVVPVIEPLVITEQIQPAADQQTIVDSIKSNLTESTLPLINSLVNIETSKTISSKTIANPVPTTTNISNNSSTSTSNINLPMAPYQSENKIPMNIVAPIPQMSFSSQVNKPTNRVLPMQSGPPQKENQKSPYNSKILAVEPPNILNKLSETVEKIQETLENDPESLQSLKFNSNNVQTLKLESASLKLVFQKQSQDGMYKISNKYISKNKVPIQISPNKQINKSSDISNNIKSNLTTSQESINISSSKPAPQIQKTTINSPKKLDNCSNIMYKVQAQDGFEYTSTSLSDLWKTVFEAVQSARLAHNLPPLAENAFNVMNGLHFLGLNSSGLRYIIEQLPGAGNCLKYKHAYHKKKNEQDIQDEIRNSCGAARCTPFPFSKQPYDMFSWLASKHRNPDYIDENDIEFACRRVSSVNLPMAMRFRQLKETSKEAVGVYRSNIHGRGLFCLRDIECGEMVIEYAGEVIRSTLTDKREKFYNSKGIGCYMFRVDDNFVIDATMKGNAARFINHSCDPNCYSRVLDILGHKHILIFALRRIMQGEELTYDYKFPFEEDKIPCTCGAKRCRKYLN